MHTALSGRGTRVPMYIRSHGDQEEATRRWRSLPAAARARLPKMEQIRILAAAKGSAERIRVVGREPTDVPDEWLASNEAQLNENFRVLVHARPRLRFGRRHRLRDAEAGLLEHRAHVDGHLLGLGELAPAKPKVVHLSPCDKFNHPKNDRRCEQGMAARMGRSRHASTHDTISWHSSHRALVQRSSKQ